MTDTDPIVITGMGAVSPLGVGVSANWQALMEGRSGIGLNTRFDTTEFACKVAGQVPDKDAPNGFDPTQFIDPKDIKKMDLFIQYGLAAAHEALAQSGWVADTPEKQAVTATIIGSGVGGSPVMAEAVHTIMTKGPRRLSPFTVPSFLANLAAGWISIKYGFKGPIGAPVTACAASAQAIGDGMRLIRTGEAEIVVCGGAEGSVDPISIGGFAATLDGLDTLVFAGGIGENAPEIRRRICAGMGFLGIGLDEDRNASNALLISTDQGPVKVRVIRTDEELMIARAAVRLTARPS